MKEAEVIESARSTVFKQSESFEGSCAKIFGYDFNQGVDYSQLFKSFVSTGFQASNHGAAIETVNQMVDVIVTTTDGIEEDLIKCIADTYRGELHLASATLRSKGLNCIGNLLMPPNDNYCRFEDSIIPLFDQMLEEQRTNVLYLRSI